MKRNFSFLVVALCALMAQAGSKTYLPGVFSVSPTQKVAFSTGNLQYQAYSGALRFADHQYDYVGDAKKGNVMFAFDKCDNRQINQYYEGWIDLFGWGTGENPSLATDNVKDYNFFAEWGEKAILNTGLLREPWRTLNWDEWLFLLGSRPNADNLHGQGTVNGIHGYILLPDNWQLPKKLSFTPNPNNWTTNVYSASQWKQMEKNGAVFLPACGYRVGREVSLVGLYGFYWSSSVYEDFSTDDARNIFFSEKKLGPRDHEKRFYGLAVRLVIDLVSKPSSSTAETAPQTESSESSLEPTQMILPPTNAEQE